MKTKRSFYIIFFLSFLLVASPLWAATYYVDYNLAGDCSGDYSIANRACNGSDGDAYNEVGELDSVVGSGDMVYIRAVDETFDNTSNDHIAPAYSGGTSESDRVTYISGTPSGRETVIFRGDPYGDNFIAATAGPYYTFEDIEIRDITSGRAFGITKNYITVKNCVVNGVTTTNAKTVQIVVGNASNDPTDVVFDNNTFDDIQSDGAHDDTDLIVVEGATEVLIQNNYFGDVVHSPIKSVYDTDDLNQKIYIYNNTFENTWRYAIDFYISGTDQQRGWFVSNNTFKNQGTVANPRTGNQPSAANFNTGGFGWMVIRLNTLYNMNGGIIVSGPSADTNKLYVVHNTFYDANNADIEASQVYDGQFIWGEYGSEGAAGENENPADWRIKNNIFSETASTSSLWELDLNYNTNNPSGCKIEANLFYDSSGTNPQRVDQWLNGDGIQSVTYWEDNDGTQWIDGSNVVNDNPDFTDAPNADFTLTSGSPAVNKGVFVAEIQGISTDTIEVNAGEEYYFFAKESFGIEYAGVSSDTIYADDGATGTLVAVNYGSATIEVDAGEGSNFAVGDKLTFVNFNGTLPDIGAYEYEATAGRRVILISERE